MHIYLHTTVYWFIRLLKGCLDQKKQLNELEGVAVALLVI
jgi:hypothetical protein